MRRDFRNERKQGQSNSRRGDGVIIQITNVESFRKNRNAFLASPAGGEAAPQARVRVAFQVPSNYCSRRRGIAVTYLPN
jgi:hypothetical protein